MYKEETKTNKLRCPLSLDQLQDPRRQSERNQKHYGERDLWEYYLRSLHAAVSMQKTYSTWQIFVQTFSAPCDHL